MDNQGTEQAWRDIENKVDELLRQSLAGNLFYRIEFGSERIARGLPRDKRANGEHNHSLRIEDSAQPAAENLQYGSGRAANPADTGGDNEEENHAAKA